MFSTSHIFRNNSSHDDWSIWAIYDTMNGMGETRVFQEISQGSLDTINVILASRIDWSEIIIASVSKMVIFGSPCCSLRDKHMLQLYDHPK